MWMHARYMDAGTNRWKDMTDRDSCISGKSAVDELGNIRVDLGTFNHAEDSFGHIDRGARKDATDRLVFQDKYART